jgi:hypothetical protein
VFSGDTGQRQEGAEGARNFGRARRAAFLGRLGRGLRRRLSGTAPCCESLRCFEQEMVSHGSERKARVHEAIELGKIVGSVGRCGAFDAGFLPVCSCSAERWKRVYGAFLEGKTLPPVELYKLGGAYFVVDGNHRVSVARYRGAAAVDAVVTEFA